MRPTRRLILAWDRVAPGGGAGGQAGCGFHPQHCGMGCGTDAATCCMPACTCVWCVGPMDEACHAGNKKQKHSPPTVRTHGRRSRFWQGARGRSAAALRARAVSSSLNPQNKDAGPAGWPGSQKKRRAGGRPLPAGRQVYRVRAPPPLPPASTPPPSRGGCCATTVSTPRARRASSSARSSLAARSAATVKSFLGGGRNGGGRKGV